MHPFQIRSAGYTDIDRNGHVNNSRAAAWCMDAAFAAEGGEDRDSGLVAFRARQQTGPA
jgi:acyl-CoA thioesterase FadM